MYALLTGSAFDAECCFANVFINIARATYNDHDADE